MARHYEIFYCLETSIRQLISDRLKEEVGTDWWNQAVPEQIKKNAEENRSRESATGMTPRSDDIIDFTTFGELGQIISANGKFFGDTFRDLKAVSRVMSSLNSLRAPIAHCCPLAEDEVGRLQIEPEGLVSANGVIWKRVGHCVRATKQSTPANVPAASRVGCHYPTARRTDLVASVARLRAPTAPAPTRRVGIRTKPSPISCSARRKS